MYTYSHILMAMITSDSKHFSHLALCQTVEEDIVPISCSS